MKLIALVIVLGLAYFSYRVYEDMQRVKEKLEPSKRQDKPLEKALAEVKKQGKKRVKKNKKGRK